MKKKLLIIISLILSISQLGAQNFLNGNFENTTATNCVYNLGNSDFNLRMPDVISYGNTPHAGVFGEADIITGSCMGGAYDGWSVSIACEANTTDKLNLKLDAPLVPGNQYQLSFFGMSNTTFNPEIHAVAIGHSLYPTNPGSILDTIIFPDSMFTQASVFFTASVAAQYISITVITDGLSNGSIKIDDFNLSIASEIPALNEASVAVVQNRIMGRLLFRGNKMQSAGIFDISGKLLANIPFENSNEHEISSSEFKAGVYLISIKTDNGIVNKKIVIE